MTKRLIRIRWKGEAGLWFNTRRGAFILWPWRWSTPRGIILQTISKKRWRKAKTELMREGYSN